MQIQPFTQGGYVIHRAMIGQSKYSAWFNRDGILLDAERIDTRGRSYTVRANTPAHAELQRIGNRYKHTHITPM